MVLESSWKLSNLLDFLIHVINGWVQQDVTVPVIVGLIKLAEYSKCQKEIPKEVFNLGKSY